jgi:epoxyqueuosine reductase QueG
MPTDARATVSLRDWLEEDDERLVDEYDRLYVPRNDARWLRRNALVAAGNTGSAALADAVRVYASSNDPMLSETAEWALERMAERGT